MLYATEGVNSDEDFQKAMIGVASVWSVHHPLVQPSFYLTRIKQVRRQSVRPLLSTTLYLHTPSDACFAGVDVIDICSVWVNA